MTMHPSCLFEVLSWRQAAPSAKLITRGLLSCTALLIGSATAHADSQTFGPVKVKGLVIDGLRGSIIVDVTTGDEVELVVDGENDVLERLETTIDDDALRIRVPSSDTNIAVVNNQGNISVVTSGGGHAEVTIGDQTYTSDDEPIELAMRATVPAGTMIHLEGLVGRTEIGDTEADVVLNCANCEATLGTIAALDLNISGTGEIAVDRIERALVTEISGGGRVDIADGGVKNASVNIVGSGEVDFAGHAVDASVSIVGSGHVRIRDVDNPIQSSVIGSGDVITGR